MEKIIETGNVVPRGYVGVVKVNEKAYPSTYCGSYCVIRDGSFKGKPGNWVSLDVYETYEDAINNKNFPVIAEAEEQCLTPVMRVYKKNNYW